MNDTLGVLQKFRSIDADKLFTLIKSRGLLEDGATEATIHALIDISESIEKIYGELIPNILNAPDAGKDDLKDKLWDIREEFRHIQYHIEDAKLTEL
jgi:hypothetical protein